MAEPGISRARIDLPERIPIYVLAGTVLRLPRSLISSLPTSFRFFHDELRRKWRLSPGSIPWNELEKESEKIVGKREEEASPSLCFPRALRKR